MRIEHFSKSEFYLIHCPPCTRFLRYWEQHSLADSGEHDALMVPFEGREISIPADPSELLPLLAEAGLCGLSLIGSPEPAMMLAGVACPNCGEDDVAWLSGTRKGVRTRTRKGGTRKGVRPECHEDSQKPFIGNFFRSSDRGFVMR
jgi:hypothetical protein